MPYGFTQCYLPPGRGDTPADVRESFCVELDFLGQGFRLWGELSSRAGRNTILGRRRRLNDRSGTDKPGLGAASGRGVFAAERRAGRKCRSTRTRRGVWVDSNP